MATTSHIVSISTASALSISSSPTIGCQALIIIFNEEKYTYYVVPRIYIFFQPISYNFLKSHGPNIITYKTTSADCSLAIACTKC
jgi:hypothetical protein